MGKVNLAMQNQFVEFAKKDGEGNDISESIKALQQAIEGKVVFDGSVTIEQIGGNRGIKAENIPTNAGVYKATGGVLIVSKTSETNLACLVLYNNNIYYELRTTTTETNFLFSNATHYPPLDSTPTENSVNGVTSGGVYNFVKPIYCHPVRLQKTSGDNRFLLTCLIFNNDATPFTLATFKEFLDNLLNVVAIPTFMTSGYYKNATTEITSASYIYCYVSEGSTLYGVQGGLAGQLDYSSVGGIWSDIFGNADLFDNVNRIN